MSNDLVNERFEIITGTLSTITVAIGQSNVTIMALINAVEVLTREVAELQKQFGIIEDWMQSPLGELHAADNAPESWGGDTVSTASVHDKFF